MRLTDTEIIIIALEMFTGISLAHYRLGRTGLLARVLVLKWRDASRRDPRRARILLGMSLTWLFACGLVAPIPLVPIFTAYQWITFYYRSRAAAFGVDESNALKVEHHV